MFYSQCILSRKGALKPIWVAAFCHKKLDKQQVSNTNISSSVDEIRLNEVAISYRVLAYLLLGVVRIYSKKVEYLYDDCNKVVSNINSFVPLKKLKQGMCAPYSSITLPERFELDGFDLELPEVINSGNVADHQQITLEVEEEPENARKTHYSSNKYYHELDLAHLESGEGEGVYTPIHEVLSPQLLENYVMVNPSDYETFWEPGTENFLGNQFSREEFEFHNIETNFGSNEYVELGTQCNKVDSRIELESILEVTLTDHGKSSDRREGDPLAGATDHGKSNDLREGDPLSGATDHGKSSDLREDDPLAGAPDHGKSDLREGDPLAGATDHGKSSDLKEGDPLAGATDETPKRSRLPNDTDVGNCGDNEPMEVRTPPNEASNRVKRIKFLDVTPLNPGKSCIVNEGDTECAGVSTPSKTEQPRFSRKRKYLLDDTIVLSNEVMKHSINDSSSLILKRTKAPVTALDVWKTFKLPSFYQDFMEPLIPRTTLLSTLFHKRSIGTPQLRESSEGPIEDRYDMNRGECSEDRAHSERNVVDYSAWNPVGSPTTSKSNMEMPVNSVYHGETDLPEIEARDIGLNLIDEDSSTSQADDNQNQNVWSTRTRRVATFLCKSFQSQKDPKSDVLNLKPVLETRTRKENARLFYEVLVLKSQGFLEVKQESPYGDICLSSTPQLMTASSI